MKNAYKSQPSVRAPTPRRKLFDLHSWCGFNLCAFMCLVVFTGTIAVISDEIDWLIHPEMRAHGQPENIDWGAMQAAVHEFADQDTLMSLSAGEEGYFNYRATMFKPSGTRYFLYIDPVKNEIVGTSSALTVQRFFRDLHRYLFMPSYLGLPLVTTMAVALLVSLYTGLKTVRNWKTVALRLRFNRGIRVAVGDFHKASGLWGIWFFLIIIVTSFWYFAEFVGAVTANHFEPSRPGIERTSGPVLHDADAAQLVQAAITAMPGFHPTSIQFAVRPTQAATVLGRLNDPLVRQRANRVFINPLDASVVHSQRSAEIGWVAYLNELADPIHFGSFGSLVTKLIWFAFGVSMLTLTLTGVWLTWRRVKDRTPTTAQWANLPLLVLVCAFAVPYLERYKDTRVFHNSETATAELIGNITLNLILETTPSNEFTGHYTLNFRAPEGRLNIREAALHAGRTELGRFTPSILGSTVSFSGFFEPEDVAGNIFHIQTLFEAGKFSEVSVLLGAQ